MIFVRTNNTPGFHHQVGIIGFRKLKFVAKTQFLFEFKSFIRKLLIHIGSKMFYCSFIVMHLTINRDSTAYVDKTGIFCILHTLALSYIDEVKFC